MKRLLSALLLSLLVSPSVFAQSQPVISISNPGEVNTGEDIEVVVELQDEAGEPYSPNILPALSFSPADAVVNDVLYDCEISDVDNCSSNNQGAVGVFEVLFEATSLPVTVTVELEGASTSRTIEGSGEAAPAAETTSTETNQPAETSNQSSDSDGQTQEVVQVGPSPAWMLMVLMAFFGAGVFAVSYHQQR